MGGKPKLLSHVTGPWKLVGVLVCVSASLVCVTLLPIKLPFSLNFSKTTEIGHTAVTIDHIKEIGEFISAKYYGEVYISLKDVALEKSMADMEEAFRKINTLFLAVISRKTTDDQLRQLEKGSSAYRKMESEVRKNSRYKLLINTNRYGILKEASGYRDDFDFLLYLHSTTFGEFKEKYGRSLNAVLTERNRKQLDNADISYIGRGWVKAGFDLSELKEGDIEITDAIMYIKLRPLIYTDINPWFIPELKIEGFEIVAKDRSDKISFEQILSVKSKCKEVLEQDALRSGIVETAKKNAEQSIGAFVKIIAKEDIIDAVIIDILE